MKNTVTDHQFTAVYRQYIDSVFRLCFSYLKNREDAEDASQITFEKYLKNKKPFLNKDHEKAWFLTTAANTCKDMLRKNYRREISLEDYEQRAAQGYDRDESLYAAILELPPKYKLAIYLHYYEGYKTEEIAKMLRKPASTIRTRLSRGRELLKKYIEEAD